MSHMLHGHFSSAIEEDSERLAYRWVALLAFGLAGLSLCSGLLILLSSASGWSWRSVLAVATGLALTALGIRGVSAPTRSANAEPALSGMLMLLGLNVLAPGWLGAAPNGEWLVPLLLVATLHRSPAWFMSTQSALLAGWFVTGIAGRGDGWVSGSMLIALSMPLAIILFYQRRAQLDALENCAVRGELRAGQLQRKLDEFRDELREKTQTASELKGKLERLSKIADTDELTGLPNRRHAREFLLSNWPIIQRAYRMVSVLYLDLRAFHDFNHHYGFRAGDVVLNRVGGILSRFARNELELAARVGNDSFMLILPGCGQFRLDEIAESITAKLQRLALPEFGLRNPGEITANIGVVSLRLDPKLRPVDLITAADRALAAAREEGAGQIVRYQPDDQGPCLQLVGEQAA